MKADDNEKNHLQPVKTSAQQKMSSIVNMH